MSKKIRKPNKSGPKVPPLKSAPEPAPAPAAPPIPPLGSDVDSLMTEWHRLQGAISQINKDITENQQSMQELDQTNRNLQNQGMQILGASSSVSRILTGLGVDPNTYGGPDAAPVADFPTPPATPKEDAFEADYAEVVEDEEFIDNPRAAAIRRRFRR